MSVCYFCGFQIAVDSPSTSSTAACDADEDPDADADFELVYKRYLSSIPTNGWRDKAMNQLSFQYLGKYYKEYRT